MLVMTQCLERGQGSGSNHHVWRGAQLTHRSGTIVSK